MGRGWPEGRACSLWFARMNKRTTFRGGMCRHLAAAVGGILMVSGCAGSGGGQKAAADPVAVLKTPSSTERAQRDAVEAIWAAGQVGPQERRTARERLKDLVWGPQYPLKVRVQAMDLLLLDAADLGQSDTRNSLRLRLPLERDEEMVRAIAERAAAGGWKEFIPGLVRSWSRPSPREDSQRPERAALAALGGGRPVEEVVLEVFVSQGPDGSGPEAAERGQRARRAAWELLGRLDASGEMRTRALAANTAGGDAMVEHVRAAARDLGCVPVTGEQLEWLEQLRDFSAADGAARRAWWEQVRSLNAGLSAEQRAGLALRHAEPVRWAAEHQPTWLAMGREQLLDELAGRLKGRETVERSGTGVAADSQGIPESLSWWRKRMAWGDALSVLVLDEALKTPGLGGVLWKQSEEDRADGSTEYGGLLEGVAGSRAARATLFKPRGTQRFGDERFVAPETMMRAGGYALAVYHFHAQKVSNREYAGPGPGDSEFANNHGRNCLVVTPVGPGRLNVDFFQPGGVRLDLGLLRSTER